MESRHRDTAARLQREVHQSRPFRTAGQEAVIALFRTADHLRRHFARVLEPWGITLQQYNVLRILRGAGDEPLPTLVVGERMLEQTPGVTRLLDRMEEKGWVARERCPEDRRRVLCRATAEGLALLRQLDGPIDAADAAVVGDLSDRQRAQLLAALERVRGALPGRHADAEPAVD